jgi:cytoskeletal protein CcmA (bactofilin family)
MFWCRTVFLMIVMLYMSLSVHAQTYNRNDIEKSQEHETDRLNKIIDDFIDRIDREILWQIRPEEEDAAAPDTTELHITFRSREGAIHFTGDVFIDHRDRIEGNIVVRNGSLTVQGRIKGDVLILNGNAVIETGGIIEGSVKTVNGRIYNTDGIITGLTEEIEAADVDLIYKEHRPAYRIPYQVSHRFQEDLTVRDIDLNPFWLGFNRVEGFSIHAGSRKNLYWDESIALSLYGQVGYAFKAHRWRGKLGATRQFVASNAGLFEIGGEVYSLTDTQDDWFIGRGENDLAAFFFHRDYKDYYDREGFSVYTGHYLNSIGFSSHLRVQYQNELHTSMKNRTDWALFVRDRSYRLNPVINEGRMNALRFAFHLSSVEQMPRRLDGWSVLGTVEYSSPSLQSDFDYRQYILDIRRYQPISKFDNFNVRFRAGSSEGDLPFQKIYELGGLGTLPAYPHKTFFGNRMLLLNAEYIIRGEILSQLSFIPRNAFGGLTLLFFIDTGWTGNTDPGNGPLKGFGDFAFNELKTSLGFGLGSRNGNSRLGFAWRADRESSAVVFLRIERPF